jgi:dipeptidase E
MQNLRTILAMGGGGFAMEPDNPLLDKFFFSLSEKAKPKVCFVSTASGDAEGYIERFYAAMKSHDVESSHLALYRGPVGSLRDYVLDKDVLYVGGGNTRNLLALWKEWNLHKIMEEAYQSGVILGGVSAGSICWFEEGVTDSIPGSLSRLNCLGFLEGSNCPHYDGEIERRPAYQRLIQEGMKAGYACDDGVAAHFSNETLVEFVSSRPNAMAYKLSLKDGKVIEELIRPRPL